MSRSFQILTAALWPFFLAIFIASCVHTSDISEGPRFQKFPIHFSATQVVRVVGSKHDGAEFIGLLKREGPLLEVAFVEPLFQSPLVKLVLKKDSEPTVVTNLEKKDQPFDFAEMGRVIGTLYFAERFSPKGSNEFELVTEKNRYLLSKTQNFDGSKSVSGGNTDESAHCVFPAQIDLEFLARQAHSIPHLLIKTKDVQCP